MSKVAKCCCELGLTLIALGMLTSGCNKQKVGDCVYAENVAIGGNGPPYVYKILETGKSSCTVKFETDWLSAGQRADGSRYEIRKKGEIYSYPMSCDDVCLDGKKETTCKVIQCPNQ